MKTVYATVAHVSGARDGKGRTEDGKLEVSLSTPKALGGADGPGTNPEQLFALGYAACFESALRFVAKAAGKAVSDARMSARVSLVSDDAGGLKLAVDLIGVIPGLSKDETQHLLEAAHQICPYSKATRGNVDVTLIVGD